MDNEKNNIEIKLIEAAIQIIQMHGFENLTVRAVAAKAKCSIGSLYNYFKDMNELILKINARTLLNLQKSIKQAISKSKGQELGKSLGKAYLKFAQHNLPFWNLLFKYKIPKDKTLPKWYRDIIDDNFRQLEFALCAHLDKEHLHRASRVLWGACHGIIWLSIEGKLDTTSSESAETLCDSLFENYLKGFK